MPGGAAPKSKLAASTEQQRDADRRDQYRESRPVAQRHVGELLDDDSEDAHTRHGAQQDK